MRRVIPVIVSRGEKYFVAECFQLPLVTQAATLDQLINDVKEAVALQLKDENASDYGLAKGASILVGYEMQMESGGI